MKKLLAVLLLYVSASVFAQQSAEQVKKALIGSWDLVISTITSQEGVVIQGTTGEKPLARATFLTNGQYFLVNTRNDLPKFASGNRMTGTAEENKAIVTGSVAHYGTYTISADGKDLVLKAIGST